MSFVTPRHEPPCGFSFQHLIYHLFCMSNTRVSVSGKGPGGSTYSTQRKNERLSVQRLFRQRASSAARNRRSGADRTPTLPHSDTAEVKHSTTTDTLDLRFIHTKIKRTRNATRKRCPLKLTSNLFNGPFTGNGGTHQEKFRIRFRSV